MISTKTEFEVKVLSQTFYNDYPHKKYNEILNKKARPYTCIMFEIDDGTFVCIPYRSKITHKYAFKFHKSVRSKKSKSGLDYTKMVLITNREYIDAEPAIIDKDEYNETIKNINRIKREAFEFIEEYIKYIKKKSSLSSQEITRRYSFCTLKYFHKELLLEEK